MPEAGLLAALVAGLIGSTHCLGMCGGIAGALGLAANGRAGLVAAYSTGRIASYAVAGAIVGGLGAGLAGIGNAGPVLRILMGAAFILLGLQVALGWKLLAPLEAAGARLWARLSPAARALMPPRHAGHALALGALWGWLPCGLVYGMLAAAAGTGSAAGGAAVMVAFGLGTAPAMIGLGWASGRGSGWLTARRKRALGWLLVIFGAWTLVTPVQFLAGSGQGGHGHHHSAVEAPVSAPLG